MSGIKLERTGADWGKFDNCLHRLIGFNFVRLNKNIGEYMVDATKERFRTGKAPDGTTWPKSGRAKESGGQTMMATRRLYNSITYRATMEGVAVGTNVIYASTHQPENGAAETVIKAKNAKYLKFKVAGRFVTKKEVRIPARPFLGINDDDVAEIAEIANRQIEEAARK
jgi:phage virion morphogenesis protein